MEDRIGFKINDNKLELVLPKFIKDRTRNSSDRVDEKIKYFKLLKKYKNTSSAVKEESLYSFENLRAEEYMYSIFEAYYLLLVDYMEFGVFVFSKKETNKKQKGRINWNKTINKSNLIISADSLIYTGPYYMNNNILYNHPLTVLYGIHLLEIEKTTGIKININNQYKKTIEDSRRTINTKEILDNYRSSMYSDRQRRVFKILEVINNNRRKLDKRSSHKNLYYLENINNLWEHMLKSVLEDQYENFTESFPKGNYYLNIEGTVDSKQGFQMIPDIIKEYKNKLYIIDAKNYLPHINKNLPATSDINKQFLYRYFLSKEFNEKNKYRLKDIENVFLLPDDLGEESIRKIGIHKFSNLENTMGNIHLYQVDFNKLVNSYMNNKQEIKTRILDTLSRHN